MTDELAERLLARVLDWGVDEVRTQSPIVQALATWKFDAYERFAHGMRFVESLALWLEQFETIAERRTAFQFVKERLVFLSEAEMNHFVEMAYPDFIRPHLLERIAAEKSQPLRKPGALAGGPDFLISQRQCLFLGLSDGARTDVFRRNNGDLSHEQILLTYEIENERAAKLLGELARSMGKLDAKTVRENPKFTTVILLDDFSGSGRSYLRRDHGKVNGKIASFHRSVLAQGSGTAKLFDPSKLEILVVLYVGTRQAREHLEQEMQALWSPHKIPYKVIIVHELDASLRIRPGSNDPMEPLIEKYYDPAIENEHTDVGGGHVKYGFAECGLPLILPHNTPNNSLALLWAETERMRALFPRVQRHRTQ